ncbi:DUF6638 family protein [uncultured Paracoccus sp.]|uniref:DUF6638 family protein n=1 Tax=uncultured Paracoccus sp. TaxID=189685 RepID=UPI00261B459C|nr:DUF6638 family protein [uncultured Paracoccus sp.]
MKRLIEKGLMFGNLIRVNSTAWVALYNRALKKVTGKETALTEFHIDISGYSPEIGDELDDMDYLRPDGGNRQFILLTTEQKTAPLLNADLSVLRDVLRAFITQNESQLFSLTARDAVLGEIDDQVWQVGGPADLAAIRHLTISADTTGNHVAEADRLTALIERFRTEPDGWWDDVLIAEMIEQAKKTGDVVRNPVHLQHTGFDVQDFWTSEFGGVYVIRSAKQPAMIFSDPKAHIDLPGFQTMTTLQVNQIAAWLARNALAEPIASARGADAAPILRQKIDFILVDAATRLGIDTGSGTRAELRRAAARMGAQLPAEIRGLSALSRYSEQGGDWPVIDSADPAYFYAIRATPGPARGLINRLLSELGPSDVRQLFITHKPLFYKLYQTWSEPKQTYVADFLAREYQIDKQGTRDALFGPEPGMAEPAMAAHAAPAGPWGGARASLSEGAARPPVTPPWGFSR